MHRLMLAAGAAALVASLVAAPPATAQVQGLEIVVPAAPGGGWDQTGRAMQSALQEDGLASGIQVVNIPGAGGTIGLAQFVSSKEGQGNALMTGGLVMLGAILTNQSPVTLDQVTPIARLTGEYEAIVVPASSDIQTLDDLIAKFKEDPQSVSWGGGSAGGTDHMLVGLIAKEVGVEPGGINYVPFSGGGEALASILGGHVTAGVSGYQEFAGQIETGDLRALAISSAERLEGIDIPTLKEQGVDVELTNWRAVFAPPGISDADKQALGDAVGQMVEGEAWQAILSRSLVAGSLSAAGRVRAVPAAGYRSRSRPSSRTSAWCSSRQRPGAGAMRGLRLGEAVLAAFILLLGVFVAIETAMLRTGPGYAAIGPKLFPWLVAAGLLLVGFALLHGARAGAVAQPAGFELDLPPALVVTAGLVLQMVLMRPAGFVIATAVLFVAVAYALGSRRIVLNAAVGLVLCAITYVAFTRGLGLVLPAGVLGPARLSCRAEA